ncbi:MULTISPECIES: DUF1365 domain-containing protein [unclassified Rhizobacter]|uniref:DUF1365 domain-containing protein n=1 Tax=unclassified Rhizobacter TaxID=2640088 RepID=UPI0006F93828|nr:MULTISPECIES: DUF1365 domain-containing protein [unclassified Rhizobacter]KQU78514.1 hypothetical protein ASC88_22270 [Rhizobacter sp. Root29]KQW11034.1 hypothetical protein ASC98_03560 [Rhizobacter sp. Root1238]KRB25380.1 hypothetical protein ASE08_04245 [Rhizobacter sp. Root16D2]
MTGAAQPLIGIGQVRHTRLRPVVNRFAYPSYFLMLPLRSLRAQPSPALHRNRFGLVSFSDRDHGDGRDDCLAWLDELLAAEGLHDETRGEVWLHCLPRVLGHTFKPVSFWYCHRADGTLGAIVVEVNNTFGERHAYLLQGPALAWGRELAADKVFHVSPFCEPRGRYRFRFMLSGVHPPATDSRMNAPMRTIARIDHDDSDGPLIRTSVSGTLAPLTARSARAAFFGMPLMTLAVVARIHWQALKLLCKRVPFVRKPAPPARFITR